MTRREWEERKPVDSKTDSAVSNSVIYLLWAPIFSFVKQERGMRPKSFLAPKSHDSILQPFGEVLAKCYICIRKALELLEMIPFGNKYSVVKKWVKVWF